jgi:hypothetical protein
VASEWSEEYFTLLQRKPEDVLLAIETNPVLLPTLLKLVSCQHGIKLVNLFSSFYQGPGPHSELLFSPLLEQGLAEGLGLVESDQPVDTVSQVRYLEIVVNIAVRGDRCFKFVGELLGRGLGLYKT